MTPLLTGKILWSYGQEVLDRDVFHEMGAHFSGVLPFHRHSGEITLIESHLVIIGDLDLKIPLADIAQVYLGFDDIFPRSLVKNFGLFWQPLRLSLSGGEVLYLVVDYSVFGPKNQLWFNALREILAD